MVGGNTVAEGATNDELAVDNPSVEVVAKSDQSQAEPGFIGIGESRPEKVLLVDDSATTRRIIKNLLQKFGYRNIVEAEDGGDGYKKLHSTEFDLVISDWTMSPVGGLDLVAKIRATETVKNLHFIMLSTASSVEDVVRAKAAGVDAYIVKPFNAVGLRDKIKMATQDAKI